MIGKQFQKWRPIDQLGLHYDIENITWKETISFTLISDNRMESNEIHRFQLAWDSSSIISCNITDETYRADCWKIDFENEGRFYTIIDSDYMKMLKEKSPLFPDNAIHFLIVGTNTIVDVLAKTYPMVCVLES